MPPKHSVSTEKKIEIRRRDLNRGLLPQWADALERSTTAAPLSDILCSLQYSYIQKLYFPLFSAENHLKYNEDLTFVTALYFVSTRDKV